MNKICFRCTVAEKGEELNDKDLLFFSSHFLIGFDECDKKDDKAKKDNTYEENENEKLNAEKYFSEYVEKKRMENNNDIEKTNKEIYLGFYSCKKCFGLHNIDIILFHKRNNKFYSNILDTITEIERKHIYEVSYILKQLYNNMIINIDIILFFFHLEKIILKNIEENYIEKQSPNKKLLINDIYKESNNDGTLEMFNSCFEKIKPYVIMRSNMENNLIKKSIYKLFTFTLLYVYFKCYKRIYDSIDLNEKQIRFLSKLYKHAKLIWVIKIERNTEGVVTIASEKKSFCKEKWRFFHKKRKKVKYEENTNEKSVSGDIEETDTKDNCIWNTLENKDIINNPIVENSKENKIKEITEEGINTIEGCHGNVHNCIRFFDMYISFNKLCVFGSYNKYNKNISQTKWAINQINKSAISVEESVSEIFRSIFHFTSATFIGSGREDKDVRMMHIGRPFVLVLNETRFSFLNFFLFFKKLRELKDSNICQIETIPQMKVTLGIDSNANILHNNDTTNDKEHVLCINEKTNDIDKKKETYSQNMYVVIERTNTNVLYNVSENKIISEEDQEIIFKERRFKDLHISVSYNKEIEELLCDKENKYPSNECLKKTNAFPVTNENENLKRKKIYNINDFVEVKLNNIGFTTNYEEVKKIMKYGEERKKAYKCLIYHTASVDREKIENINKNIWSYEEKEERKLEGKKTNREYVLNVFQKTPIRVLHRRSLLKRERKIYDIKLVYVHSHCSLLYVLSESGLYIKEFVSGDKCRTFPNLKFFFDNKFVNVLNLDVSKLVYS